MNQNPFHPPRVEPNAETPLPEDRNSRFTSWVFFGMLAAMSFVSAAYLPKGTMELSSLLSLGISVAWLSIWLSSLIYRHLRQTQQEKPMRLLAMCIGILTTVLLSNVVSSKPLILVSGVLAAGGCTYANYSKRNF